jgi:hypothetical protein
VVSIPMGGVSQMYVSDCADYYVYGNVGVPTPQLGVGGAWVRAWARLEMTPARVTPTRVFYIPAWLRVVSA